jgi:type I restriction enzyme S subunit
LKSLIIPLPPLPEQQKIASILSSVDEKIEAERRRKEKLEELKKGLMQNLLIGKVRVKVEECL